ncbi:MAG: hypothetical protein WCA44_08380 [Acidobacteriaceae bacterium]
MRSILSIVVLLATTCALPAQTNRSSWENLNALRAGQKIQVVEIGAKKHTGLFVSVSATAIVLTETGGDRTIAKQDVRTVKLLTGGHRLRHTLIGAGVGAGAGGGITAAAWEPHGFLGGKGTGAAVGAIIGGVVGAIVGALLPSHPTLYTVSSR